MQHCFARGPRSVVFGIALAGAFTACEPESRDPSTDQPTAGRDSSAAGASGANASAAGASAAGASGVVAGGAAGETTSAGSHTGGGSGGELGVAGASTSGAGVDGGHAGAPGGGSAGTAGSAPNAGSAGMMASAGAGGGELPKLTVWIAGDSTVANGGPCPVGWGGQIKALFNDKVSVTNSAVGGRSVRTWLYDPQSTKDSAGECVRASDASGAPTLQARWTSMRDGMKQGDYLLIQFGINDGDSACPRHVGVLAFKESYGLLAREAKERGVNPVFVTPVSQIACSGSTVTTNTRQPYVTATKEAGAEFAVPVIDLNSLSTALYRSLGFCPIPGGSDVSATTTGAVGTFFCDDHTHFDTPGAAQIAGVVAKALRDQKIGLAAYLK